MNVSNLETQKLPSCRNISSTNRLFTGGIQQNNQSKQKHKSNKQYINLIYVKHEKIAFKILNFHVAYRFRVNFQINFHLETELYVAKL